MEGYKSCSEPSPKRQKTSDGDSLASIPKTDHSMPIAEESPRVTQSIFYQEDEAAKEEAVGIRCFVGSHSPGFSGTLKKRYTDFIVNEILPRGEVLHLRNLEAQRNSLKSTNDGKENNSASVQVKEGQAEGKASPLPTEDVSPSKQQASQQKASSEEGNIISEADRLVLKSYLEEETTLKLLALFDNVVNSPERHKTAAVVVSAVTPERSTRATFHAEIRRIFSSRMDSFTDTDGVLKFAPAKTSKSAGKGAQNRRAKVSWAERGGEYLHFSIYKENRDTMEVISHLCRSLKMNAKSFQFAGTKDKRAVTVQRSSVYRMDAGRLASQNQYLRGSALGDFRYQNQGLQLGDLEGNEFHLTLRDCCFVGDQERTSKARVEHARQTMSLAIHNLREMGFLNFYGLQRFGTFSTTTDTVGLRLLRGDFKGAVDAILHYGPDAISGPDTSDAGQKVGFDDRARAEAIRLFQTTNKAFPALEKMPRKFSAESNLIRHLSKNKNDYAGALATIPRNLRLMYVHAYQSLVWNHAVAERFKLHAEKLMEGDLVLVNEHRDKVENRSAADDVVDADGEAIMIPSGEDSAVTADDRFERARALTAEEASSGKYSIFDVVLPLPGYDVLYPPNEMTDFYKSFMASEKGGGLDPFDMRRKQKDYSLSGSYRKMLARIGPDYEVDVRAYEEADQQFVQTDLERVRRREDGNEGVSKATVEASERAEEGSRLAVILKFQLGSSQYATMALRELSKGGIRAWKPEFSTAR